MEKKLQSLTQEYTEAEKKLQAEIKARRRAEKNYKAEAKEREKIQVKALAKINAEEKTRAESQASAENERQARAEAEEKARAYAIAKADTEKKLEALRRICVDVDFASLLASTLKVYVSSDEDEAGERLSPKWGLGNWLPHPTVESVVFPVSCARRFISPFMFRIGMSQIHSRQPDRVLNL